MINICIHCGHHFTTPVNRYNKPYGEGDNSLPYFPNCGSENFEPAGHCIKCDDYFPLDSMIGSICRECVEKRMTRDTAYRYGNDRKAAVEINGFVAYSWKPQDVTDELFHACTTEDARAFCSDDIYDFSEWLEGQDD